MRSRATLRFLATVILLIVARGLDALSTWVATRDLSLEMNPLTRVLHVGWGGLLLMNVVVIAFISLCAWRAEVTPAPLPSERGLDIDAFIGRYWFAVPVRRSRFQAAFWLPADRRVRRAFIGSGGAALIIVGSIVASAWNMLVARDVIVGRSTGLFGVAIFWIGLTLGVGLSVRWFLTRAYSRYLRAMHEVKSSALTST